MCPCEFHFFPSLPFPPSCRQVLYHVHEGESRAPHQELVDKYLGMGLSQEVTDFVCMVMEGKEGTASMR